MTAEPGDQPRTLPVLTGIGGCSGSGKTTLAAALSKRLSGVHFRMDSYYRDLSGLPRSKRAEMDFDDPAMIELELLGAHLAALARGESIERPIYEFSSHTRVAGQTETVEAAGFIFVDGIFALHYAELLPVYGLRVYVEAADEVCFARRLKRDMEQRGRSARSILHQYECTVRPASIQFVRPSARNADLIVDGSRSLEGAVGDVLARLQAGRLPGSSQDGIP